MSKPEVVPDPKPTKTRKTRASTPWGIAQDIAELYQGASDTDKPTVAALLKVAVPALFAPDIAKN